MKIKRINTVALLAATLLAPPLWAADGTLQFTGRAVEGTCVLDAGSQNMTVNMGRKPADVGKMSSDDEFIIQLNDCPTSSDKARIRFEGTSAGGVGYYRDNLFAFSNTGQAGAGGNVGFLISEGNYFDELVPVNGEGKTYDLNTGAGSVNPLRFMVGYVRIDDSKKMTPGTLVGNVQFSIVYP